MMKVCVIFLTLPQFLNKCFTVKTENTEEIYGNGLNTRCSEEERKLTPKKHRLLEGGAEMSSEDGNSDDDICLVGSGLFHHGRTFKPHYLLSA